MQASSTATVLDGSTPKHNAGLRRFMPLAVTMIKHQDELTNLHLFQAEFHAIHVRAGKP